MSFELCSLAPAPIEEPCAQVGTADYADASMAECLVFGRMLNRVFPVPEGVSAVFIIKSFVHDYGAYREVCLKHQGEAGALFAAKVENELPLRWDEIAVQELAWFREKDRLHRAARASGSVDEISDMYRSFEPPAFSAVTATSFLAAA